MRVIDIDFGSDGSNLNELSSLTVLRNKWCARKSPISDFLNYLVDYQGKAKEFCKNNLANEKDDSERVNVSFPV